MTRYLALLRGINLGSHNRVPMKELKTAMESQGFEHVATYLQSGSVLFDTSSSDASQLATRLGDLIAEEFEVSIPIVIQTSEQLKSAASHNPYLDEEDDFKKLHVMFLDAEPDPARVDDLDPERSPGDRFTVEGSHIYLHFPNGSARSKLAVDYFERRLGVTATGRNWNTVLKLHSMMSERED